MARKTIKSLENELNATLNLNKRYVEDIAKLRQEIENIKADKDVIALVEYNQLMSQLDYQKTKNKILTNDIKRADKKYKDLLDKTKKKNARGAGRKMFQDKMIIKRIYDLYLEGKSLRNIADILNDDSTEIKKWSKSTVRFILLNKKNIELKFIDEDTYNTISELFDERRKNKNNNKKL